MKSILLSDEIPHLYVNLSLPSHGSRYVKEIVFHVPKQTPVVIRPEKTIHIFKQYNDQDNIRLALIDSSIELKNKRRRIDTAAMLDNRAYYNETEKQTLRLLTEQVNLIDTILIFQDYPSTLNLLEVYTEYQIATNP